jgi:DNA invertase Pin-like site-specific DNA recombinase
VSTEEQERKGESLITQETQIREFVQILGGVVPETCWAYSGQESATRKERILWDKLLDDSSKNIFDAVIVCDASRWSRNNQKSLEGLEILRNNKIRFFIGTSERNLNLPADRMTIGLFTTLNQFNAEEQSRKSQDSRIHRARRGVPTAGKLPYGRTWNKKTEVWGIDPIKQKIIHETARRYLAGESIKTIARSFNVDASTLFKSLTQRCGDTWECRYRDKVTNTVETVTMTIPRLLDQVVIDAVNERMQNNITYVRGNRKHENLLQGMIYCKRCGLKMSAFTNNYGKRYYRHSLYSKDCDFHKYVPANEIENAVLVNLVMTFGDYAKVERAIAQASPDGNRREELVKTQEHLLRELRKVAGQKEKIIESIADGVITKEDAKNNIDKIKQYEEVAKSRLFKIEQELTNIPDPANVKRVSLWAAKVIRDATKNNPAIIFKRSFKWKRTLVERAFGGVDHNGSRYGVFIDHDGRFTFEIRGILFNTVSSLPMSDEEIAEAFHIDPDSNNYSYIKKGLPTG